jgi:hypothetical protein
MGITTIRVLAPICDYTAPCGFIRRLVVKETEVIGTFANNDIIYIDSTELTMRNLVWIKRNPCLISCMGVLIIVLQEWFDLKYQKQNKILFSTPARTNFKIKPTAKIVG